MILSIGEIRTFCNFIDDHLNEDIFSLKLLYRHSTHNKSKSPFRKLCDFKGPTITIIKTKSKQVFGGYDSDSVSWQSHVTRNLPCSFIIDLQKLSFPIGDVDVTHGSCFYGTLLMSIDDKEESLRIVDSEGIFSDKHHIANYEVFSLPTYQPLSKVFVNWRVSDSDYFSYFYVKRAKDKQWRRRFVVLKNNFLSFSKTHHSQRLDAAIPLHSESTVKTTTDSSDCIFELWPGKHFKWKMYFGASSVTKCTKWIAAIQKASKLKIKDIYRYACHTGSCCYM